MSISRVHGKYFVFTIQLDEFRPPTESAISGFKSQIGRLCESSTAFCRFQLERVTRYHYQCAIKFDANKRILAVQKLLSKFLGVSLPFVPRPPSLSAPLAYADNPVASFNYSKKAESRIEGPWDIGIPQDITNQGGNRRSKPSIKDSMADKAEQLVSLRIDPRLMFLAQPRLVGSLTTPIKAMVDAMVPPRQGRVTFSGLWGSSGSGKSKIMRLIIDYTGLTCYTIPGKQVGSGRWLGNYQGESIIFIEEMESNDFSPSTLKLLTDRYPCQMACKMGGVSSHITAKTVLFTAQEDIHGWPGWKPVDLKAIIRRMNELGYYGEVRERPIELPEDISYESDEDGYPVEKKNYFPTVQTKKRKYPFISVEDEDIIQNLKRRILSESPTKLVDSNFTQ